PAQDDGTEGPPDETGHQDAHGVPDGHKGRGGFGAGQRVTHGTQGARQQPSGKTGLSGLRGGQAPDCPEHPRQRRQ
ncbi:hypothetical protein RZS08_25535, partial [Arthrospira platensis SPKY1]|nr:hypothetical protein [Arthrospira platensis SPKY1]